MTEAEKIITEFVNHQPQTEDGACFYCHSDSDDTHDPALHWTGCLWRRAAEWAQSKGLVSS